MMAVIAALLFLGTLAAAIALMTGWFRYKRMKFILWGVLCGVTAFFLGLWAAAMIFLAL